MGLLPKRGYLLLFTGFILGVLIAAFLSSAFLSATGGGTVTGVPDYIEITFLYSSEKQGWLEEVTPLFEKWFKERHGIDVKVKLIAAGTHETINLILHGSVKPTIWSPASSIWIPYLNEKWKRQYGYDIALEWVPLVTSPVVIAGWRDLVEQYNIQGFMDLFELARNGIDFKWGHPDPQLSNGGTMTVLLEFAEAAGKPPSELTVEDILNETVIEIVKTIEKHAVAYGKSTGFFGAWAVDNGPEAISFFGVYESIVLENSYKAQKKWNNQIIAVYPSFGTLLSDHPFVILRAEWINKWQEFAAAEYLYFLLLPEIQQKAQIHGFRPANPSVPLNPEVFSEKNGVEKEIPVRVFLPPSGGVLEAILKVWEKVKNPGV